MNSGQVGARSELIAAAWLLEHGCEVFRNVAANASCRRLETLAQRSNRALRHL